MSTTIGDPDFHAQIITNTYIALCFAARVLEQEAPRREALHIAYGRDGQGYFRAYLIKEMLSPADPMIRVLTGIEDWHPHDALHRLFERSADCMFLTMVSGVVPPEWIPEPITFTSTLAVRL